MCKYPRRVENATSSFINAQQQGTEEVEEEIVDYEPWMDDYNDSLLELEVEAEDHVLLHPEVIGTRKDQGRSEIEREKGRCAAQKKQVAAAKKEKKRRRRRQNQTRVRRRRSAIVSKKKRELCGYTNRGKHVGF
jgi:hypothetical protein